MSDSEPAPSKRTCRGKTNNPHTQPTLLLLDSATPHTKAVEQLGPELAAQGVTLLLIPAKVTGLIQPLDASGAFRSIKAAVRNCFYGGKQTFRPKWLQETIALLHSYSCLRTFELCGYTTGARDRQHRRLDTLLQEARKREG